VYEFSLYLNGHVEKFKLEVLNYSVCWNHFEKHQVVLVNGFAFNIGGGNEKTL
jgi:hypothetical protein